MGRTPITPVRLPDGIKAAALKWLAKNGNAPLSETMIVALCNHIGRPELVAEMRGRGRPKLETVAEPVKAAKPVKVAKRKAAGKRAG